MIVVLGDIHFRSDYPWFVESAEHFLKWFDDWDLNTPNNELDTMIQGVSCLMLPFITPTLEIPSPNKYYSDLHKTRGFISDVVFGHVQDTNFPGDAVKNIEKLSKYICLGHIHSRVHKNYVGSI